MSKLKCHRTYAFIGLFGLFLCSLSCGKKAPPEPRTPITSPSVPFDDSAQVRHFSCPGDTSRVLIESPERYKGTGNNSIGPTLLVSR